MKCPDCDKEATSCRCIPGKDECYSIDGGFIGGGTSSYVEHNVSYGFCLKCKGRLDHNDECLDCDILPTGHGWVLQALLGDVGGQEVLLMTRPKRKTRA